MISDEVACFNPKTMNVWNVNAMRFETASFAAKEILQKRGVDWIVAEALCLRSLHEDCMNNFQKTAVHLS